MKQYNCYYNTELCCDIIINILFFIGWVPTLFFNCISKHKYLLSHLGIRCNDFTPSVYIKSVATYESVVEGSAEDGIGISNCTSGVSGVGYEGDTCIAMYDNVTELWTCQVSINAGNWTKTSCKLLVYIDVYFHATM